MGSSSFPLPLFRSWPANHRRRRAKAYARFPSFRSRSSVSVSPFCRCKIPFVCKNYVRKFRSVTAVNIKKRYATGTATANVNGETATEERQPEWWKPGISVELAVI